MSKVVVLGGHAHKIIQNEYHNGILFVESGCYLQNVSRVTVETDDKTGKFVSAKSELIPLYISKTGQYAPVAALAEALKEPGMDKVLGSASAKLSRTPVKGNEGDSPLNNWVADICRDYSDAEVFIHNNGGTRVDLEKGTVTKRDLVNMHPFGNTITNVKVSGKFLEKFVKFGLAPRNLFSYSGLKVEYKLRKGKVQDLKICMRNDSGITAHIAFGMDNSYKCELEVWGSTGSIVANRIFTAPAGFEPTITVTNAQGSNTHTLPADDTFKKSILHFLQCISDANTRQNNYNQLLLQANLVDTVRQGDK